MLNTLELVSTETVKHLRAQAQVQEAEEDLHCVDY